jgi:hypothetical protein
LKEGDVTYQLVSPTETRPLTQRELLITEFCVLGDMPKTTKAIGAEMNRIMGELYDLLGPPKKATRRDQVLGDNFSISAKVGDLSDWYYANRAYIQKDSGEK